MDDYAEYCHSMAAFLNEEEIKDWNYCAYARLVLATTKWCHANGKDVKAATVYFNMYATRNWFREPGQIQTDVDPFKLTIEIINILFASYQLKNHMTIDTGYVIVKEDEIKTEDDKK